MGTRLHSCLQRFQLQWWGSQDWWEVPRLSSSVFGFKVLLVSCPWITGRLVGGHLENGYAYVAHSPKRLQIASGCWQQPEPILTVSSSHPCWHGHRAGWLQEPSSARLHATLAASPLLLLLHTGCLQHLFESVSLLSLFPVYTGSYSPSSWLWQAVMSRTVWIHPQVVLLQAQGNESSLCSFHLWRNRSFSSWLLSLLL